MAGVRSSRQRRRVVQVVAATGAAAIVFVAGALLLTTNQEDSQRLITSDNPISTSANHQPPIRTPRNVTNALASHSAMGHNILRADAFLKRPETNASIVAGGDGFAAVFR